MKYIMIGLMAIGLMACDRYIPRAECEAKGGQMVEKGTGHFSGVKLPKCDEKWKTDAKR